MYSSVLGLLAFCLPALAAPTEGPAASRASLQVLNYNDLSGKNNGTAAVLVRDLLPKPKALAQCAAIGEELFPMATVPVNNRTEMQYQLDYLVWNHDLPFNASFWVSSQGSSGDCMAYQYHTRKILNVPCSGDLFALCTSSVPPTTDKDRVAVDSSKLPLAVDEYTMTGFRDARSFRFLGIPFANPPVGKLRFASPEPYTGPKRLDATKYSNSCIQAASSFGTLNNEGISEDCLYLNVYTPVLPSHDGSCARRPVAVYFYGGAFLEGSANLVDYDGGNFASRNDVVVVTVNYRVGPLGFLSTGNLTTGSYGTRDQILALKWVQNHIASFGGDADKVTIFGQSAGGQSVVALLSSSSARGLFSAAISQSAPLDLPWYTTEMYHDLVLPPVAKAVGCDHASSSEESTLACLRSVPALEYLTNTTAFDDATSEIAKSVAKDYTHITSILAGIEPFMPAVGGKDSGVIDDQFHSLLNSSSLPVNVPTMFTTVTDEAYLYIDNKVPSLGSTQVGINLGLDIAYPKDLADKLVHEDVYQVNRSDPDGVRDAMGDALTASEWTCPQSFLLDLANSKSSPSSSSAAFPRLFQVEIGQGHVQTTVDVPSICSPNDNINASCHASDVLLVWGTLDSKTQSVDSYYSTQDWKHSQLLNDVFGSFFRSHDPNPDPEFLGVRGPAYRASFDVFAPQVSGYRIQEYRGQKELSLLDMPPSMVQNPGKTKQCKVFGEHGFTFQHVDLTA